jgi:hypothetical protein
MLLGYQLSSYQLSAFSTPGRGGHDTKVDKFIAVVARVWNPGVDVRKAVPRTQGAVLTYLIPFASYACHLHGEEAGSIDGQHNLPGGRLVEPDPTSGSGRAAPDGLECCGAGQNSSRPAGRQIKKIACPTCLEADS